MAWHELELGLWMLDGPNAGVAGWITRIDGDKTSVEPAYRATGVSWPAGTTPRMVLADAPSPSAGADPAGFVWTSAGQELEISASRNGPIVLHAATEEAGEVRIAFGADAAEMLSRLLDDFHVQLNSERWEPVYEAERQNRPKPPAP